MQGLNPIVRPQSSPENLTYRVLPGISNWNWMDPASTVRRYTYPPADISFPNIEVQIKDLRAISFTSGPKAGREGLMLRIIIADPDENALWTYFQQTKEAFAEYLSASLKDILGPKIEVSEIQYKRGSLDLTILMDLNTWVMAHEGLIQLIGFIFGLYEPIKALIKDAHNWVPRVKLIVVDFFRRPLKPRLVPKT